MDHPPKDNRRAMAMANLMWMVVAQISMQYMSRRGLVLVMSGKVLCTLNHFLTSQDLLAA